MIFKFPINDAHIHLFDVKAIEECIAMVDFCGYSHWNFLAYTMLDHKGCFANNLLAALMKLKEKGRCRAFASFDYAMDFTVPKAEELKRQIQFFDLAGFDGIKMLDGKPFVRMRQGIPLDAPNYDLMFDYAEKSQMPITYHINDPIEFWYWEKLPEWAKKENNFYGNGTYLHKWELDEEAFGFLRKHPKLNIVLPHFFFVSDSRGCVVNCFIIMPISVLISLLGGKCLKILQRIGTIGEIFLKNIPIKFCLERIPFRIIGKRQYFA